MDHTAYLRAERRVERRIGFFIHLSAYLLVNSSLMLFNLQHRPDRLWAVGPLLGWGIGLLFHGLSVFLVRPGATWKQRLIEREMNKRLPSA